MPQDISLMNLLIWAIFGFVVGFAVHAIDPGDVKGGVTGTAVLGIVGALLGGYLASVILGHTVNAFSIEGFVTAVIGGLVLAFLSRLFFRERGHIKTATERLK